MRMVLDASTALTFVLDDEYDESAAFMLSTLKRVTAVVPVIWRYEVLNGLLNARKRKRIDDAGVAKGIELLERLYIEVDRDPPGMAETYEIANRFSLSSYDATYIALAQREGISLCTNDADMIRACKALKIGVR